MVSPRYTVAPLGHNPVMADSTCLTCGHPFQVTAQANAILSRVSNGVFALPPPVECPLCRRRRRQAWQNEKTLYRRTCDLSGEQMVAIYSPDKPFPVYSHASWNSDGWDALTFGVECDPEKSMFEQFRVLQQRVPRKAQNLISCENCDFNNNLWNSKNAYLSFMSSYLVDCYYDYASWDVKDSIEVWYSKFIQLSHTIIASENLYQCYDCERCFTSSNLHFCKRLIGCSDCFGCYGLKHKRFHIFNEPVSEAEYRDFLAAANLGSARARAAWKQQWNAFLASSPREATVTDDFSELSTGNYLFRTARSEQCFVATDVEDSSWLFESARIKDCADLDFSYSCTLCVDSASAIGCYQSAFLDNCQECTDSYYLSQCAHCTNCFLCIGLKRKSFCILNRQYSEQDYRRLTSVVVAAMTARGEWGRFFPLPLSDFGYNETEAALNLPLTEREAAALGARWCDYVAPLGVSEDAVISASSLPDHVRDADAQILQRAIRCERTGKLFRIISKELAFHQRHEIPLPRLHPLERYRDLIAQHGGTELRAARCVQCQARCDSVYGSEEASLTCPHCFKHWLEAHA